MSITLNKTVKKLFSKYNEIFDVELKTFTEAQFVFSFNIKRFNQISTKMKKIEDDNKKIEFMNIKL